MHKKGRSTLESFQHVQEFLGQHPFTDSPADLGRQAAELDDVIARLSSELVKQEESARFIGVCATALETAREALYKHHMQPIARIAREVYGLSGMDRAFRLPKGWTATQPLLAAAGAMAGAAEREQATFTERGFAPDFVRQFRDAIAALEQLRTSSTETRRNRVTATATMEEQLKRGRSAVRQLNAILAPRLAKEPALQAAWQSAKRVRPMTAAGSGEVATPDIQKVA